MHNESEAQKHKINIDPPSQPLNKGLLKKLPFTPDQIDKLTLCAKLMSSPIYKVVHFLNKSRNCKKKPGICNRENLCESSIKSLN